MVLVALPFRYRVLDQLALRQCGAPLEAGILWELAAEIEPRLTSGNTATVRICGQLVVLDVLREQSSANNTTPGAEHDRTRE
jgi:hypothetical protein